MAPTPVALFAVLALTGAAAISDARTGHIPNWLTFPPILIAPILHGVWGGFVALGVSLAALLICGLVPYLMFRKGAAGGGDVKLLSGVGAICGVSLGLEAQIFGFAAAVLAALAVLAWRGGLLRTLVNSLLLAVNPLLPARRRRQLSPATMSSVRLGVPIFLGTLCALWLRDALGAVL